MISLYIVLGVAETTFHTVTQRLGNKTTAAVTKNVLEDRKEQFMQKYTDILTFLFAKTT